MMKKTAIYMAAMLMILIAARTSSAFCFEEAGAKYNISPRLLWAIAKVESEFNPEAYNKNSKGLGYDYGLMQINSLWRSTLGAELWDRLNDACTNVHVGAWILAQSFQTHGYNWEAVGYYNARTKYKRDKYVQKIQSAVKEANGYSTLPIPVAGQYGKQPQMAGQKGKIPPHLAKLYARIPLETSPTKLVSRIKIITDEEEIPEQPQGGDAVSITGKGPAAATTVAMDSL